MLHRKLVLVNAVIIILSMAIVSNVAVFTLRESAFRNNSVLFSMKTEETSNRINEEFRTAERLISDLSKDRNLTDLLSEETPDRKELEDTLSSITSGNVFDYVMVLPVSGQDVYVLSDNGGWIKQENMLKDYPEGSDIKWIFRPEGEACYRVMKAVYSEDAITAVVYGDVSLNNLTEKIDGFVTESGFDCRMSLLDENGNYLITSDLNGRTDIAENGDSLTVTESYPGNGWKTVATVSNDELKKVPDDDINRIYGSAAVLGFAGLLLMYVVTRKATDPIQELADSMQEYGQKGKYEHLPVPEDAGQEARILYESYNYLADEVNQSITNIQEISKKERENQFMLLQAQINPHFLYNTLNTIGWLAQNNQNEEIQGMVVSLVKLFRTSLNSGKPTVTVEQEIDNVTSYLRIMQYRYPDSYDIELDVSDEAKDYIIIKQILQPLAENAIMHGFVESSKDGIIKISARVEGDELVLKVSNSGTEIDLEMINKLLNNDPELADKHYGIRNINGRLIQYYGEGCGLKYSVEDGITTACIRLPLDKVREEYYE